MSNKPHTHMPRNPSRAAHWLESEIRTCGYRLEYRVDRERAITLPPGLGHKVGRVLVPMGDAADIKRKVTILAHELCHVHQQRARRMGVLGWRYLIPGARSKLEAEAYGWGAWAGVWVGHWASMVDVEAYGDRIINSLACGYQLRKRRHRKLVLDAIRRGAALAFFTMGDGRDM